MTSRVVTVTLAVAMGLLLNNPAHSQTEAEQPPISILPEEGLGEDGALQGELPLQGVPVEPATDELLNSIPPPPDLSRVKRDAEWLYSLRRRLMLAPWSKIALGSSGLFVLGAMGWAGLAYRKRARRAYRRKLRVSGGSRPERLEEVVASVQQVPSRSTRLTSDECSH